jgi:hypothetical protein
MGYVSWLTTRMIWAYLFPAKYSVTVLLNKPPRCIVKHDTPVRAVWTAMGLLYRLCIMVKCVCYVRVVDSLVSWPWCNHSLWFGHYRTYVISWCGPLGVGPDRWLGHWHCIIGPSGQHQPCWEEVISRIDHVCELWPIKHYPFLHQDN